MRSWTLAAELTRELTHNVLKWGGFLQRFYWTSTKLKWQLYLLVQWIAESLNVTSAHGTWLFVLFSCSSFRNTGLYSFSLVFFQCICLCWRHFTLRYSSFTFFLAYWRLLLHHSHFQLASSATVHEATSWRSFKILSLPSMLISQLQQLIKVCRHLILTAG